MDIVTTETPEQEAKNWWALAVSGLFHPLLVPTYMYVLLMVVNPFLFGANGFGESRALLTLLMMVLYTAVIPMVSVLLMVALNMVGSVMMEEKTERIGPLLLVMVLYFWVYYNLSNSNDVPTIFSTFLLGVVIALALAFVINVLDKISLHAVGMGGLVGMLMITMGLFGANGVVIGDYTIGLGVLLIAGVLLAGLVGTARLALRAHDKVQVYSGYLVGFLAQLVALKFYF
ncbi:hypothetical protein FUA23_10520 [Neolewinella aurantiaca]|uniref:Uncharacterized protein n=1 Tax=Neolewinella aurantiaca TaxID=2602767 RepID=A0A5C7FV42_9BACT|nr:hypothetical protein [Neolewinella aurantiaca]TXF89392.1 hypothetical protein FUA23_10520 [Neolewinella aurantiaca]